MSFRGTRVKRDYYEVLGINQEADEATIKQAYRRLAIKYHPDRNHGDTQAAERMKEINEAYAILSDPRKRQRYDTYGQAGLEGYTAEDVFGGIDFGSLFREFGLRDIFSGFGFGGSILEDFNGSYRSRFQELEARRGADLEYELEVDLEEAFRGAVKKITLPRNETCPACQGSGAARGGISTCRDCGGTGQLVREQRSGYSVFRQITTCRRCRGAGRIVTAVCPKCNGRGMLETEKEIAVQIPRGVDSGHTLKIPGQGEPGSNHRVAGDLYIKLQIKKHPLFERQGSDIYIEKEISLTQALLGGTVRGVPGLEGEFSIQIPEGTENGTVIRIAAPRMPGYEEERGDEYVRIKVSLPRNLNDEEKQLLRQFERLRTLNLDPLYLCQPCFGFPALPPPVFNKNQYADKK
jgi:molecular chaperone DnaJ